MRGIVIALAVLPAVTVWSQAYKPSEQDLRAAYQRANDFGKGADAETFNLALKPNWMGSAAFWYRRDLADQGKEFVVVDTATGVKRAAFDPKRLAEALAKELGKAVEPTKLPFSTIELTDGAVLFRVDQQGYRVDLKTYAIAKDDSVRTPAGAGGRGQRPAGTPPPSNGRSPDGNWTARLTGGKVEIKPKDGEWQPLGTTGDMAGFRWSPDSKTLVAFHLIPGDRKKVYLLKAAVPGTTRAQLEERLYDQPGDKLDTFEFFLYDIASKSETKAKLDPIFTGSQPWEDMPEVRWTPDSSEFLTDNPTRGFSRYRIEAVNAKTGDVRTVIDEVSKTFVDVWHLEHRPLQKTPEAIWRSERSGWANYYLVNLANGETKPITQQNFVVRSILRVDEDKRTMIFTANGLAKDQDPYYIHAYRVNLDGTGLLQLTDGDGTHEVELAPDGRTLTDTWSRVDKAPVHELRSAETGKLIATLERGENKTGIALPERFVAKGRDGKTDIYGIVIRPSNFDPKKKYPIIENIYAGPHDSFVPKAFRPFFNMNRLAELGFIVVQVDGMGTNNRGKAFHDVCWKNIADAGFPDRIAWMRALAKKYPYVDVSRVGIYGTSAGGQNAAAAALFQPEFYKAAVASCGCHDNRIDKMWWNESWMGEIGPHYKEQSNIENAAKLQGHLLLMVGEQDRNVPPETTIRFADALIKANKEFDFVIIPGADHTDGGPYGERKRRDFFVRWLHGVNPPDWNQAPARR